jgi:hypothetical protein
MIPWLIVTVETAVLSLLVGLVTAGRRVRPATVHLLWSVVLIQFVVPPLVDWPRPFWRAVVAATREASSIAAFSQGQLADADSPEIQTGASRSGNVAGPATSPEEVGQGEPDVAHALRGSRPGIAQSANRDEPRAAGRLSSEQPGARRGTNADFAESHRIAATTVRPSLPNRLGRWSRWADQLELPWGRAAAAIWLIAAAGYLGWQAQRVRRFRQRLRGSGPVPRCPVGASCRSTLVLAAIELSGLSQPPALRCHRKPPANRRLEAPTQVNRG